MKRVKILVCGFFVSALAVLGFGSSVSAADFATIKAKAAYEGVYNCINNGTGAALTTGEGLLAASFKASDGAGGMLLGKGSGSAVKLPFGLTDATDNNANCKQVLFGFNSNINGDELNKGLFPLDIQETTDKSKLKEYFAGRDGNGGPRTIGYKAEGVGNVESGQTTQQQKLVLNESLVNSCRDSDGNLAYSGLYTGLSNDPNRKKINEIVFPTVTKDASGNWVLGDNSSSSKGINVPEPGSGGVSYFSFCDDSTITVQDNGTENSINYSIMYSYNSWYNNGGTLTSSNQSNTIIITAGGGEYSACTLGDAWYEDNMLAGSCVDGTVSDTSDFDDWQFTWDAPYMYIISKLSSTTNSGYRLPRASAYGDLALTDQEVYDLYVYYLRDVFKVPVVCEGDTNYELYSAMPAVKWKKGSECKADTGSPNIVQSPGNVYGVGSDNHFTATVSIDDVIAKLNALNLDELEETEEGGTIDNPNGTNPGGNGNVSGQPGDSGEATCGNSGGAMSLGWIVCPLLDWMGTASNTLYTGAVEPALQVKATLLDPNDSGSSTQEAWRVFQNLANIIFIILFLVVIFSQLTGVGIDNYGIKRILPKMVVVAILINLSYYICMIAVDVSNIVGSGIQALFNGIDIDVPTELSVTVGSDTGKAGEFAATAITGVAILGALAGMVGAIWANPAVVLSLLVGALGVIIAICFLFILLSARQAAIIVLVVISPVAIACYMLPNTKKLFDRWLQMGKGLLLVYPIAGALVGGGNFVSKLLLSSGFATGGFFEALTAMIVGIIPIFFIPSVLKSSFAAMGNLGAKISGVGAKLGSGAKGLARGSEGYKNAQKMGLERRARVKAGVDKDGNLTASGKVKARFARSGVGRLVGAGTRQAAYMTAAGKTREAGVQADAMLSGAIARDGIAASGDLEMGGAVLRDSNGDAMFKAGTEGAYYGKQFVEAANRGDISGMNAAIEAMRNSNMKPKDIAKMMRYAERSGQFKFKGSTPQAQANARAAWYRDMSKRYGNDFMATDFELQNFAQMGGGGVLGDYGDFARSGAIGMDDIKPEDIGKLSSDSLAGLAMSGGLINQSMAQRAIEANPNMSADKKIMLSAIANGATVTDINAFKNEAKALMNEKAGTVAGSAFANNGTMSIGGVTVTETMRNAWTSVTPDQVNVVQNFNGGGQQFNPVDVNIRGGNQGQGGGAPTPPAIP